MNIKQFVKKNKQFWWYVKDISKLDESAIVEGVIKYGDMKEIRQMIGILGLQNTAMIFARQISGQRTNYDDRTINYFKLYFKYHAK